MLKKLTTIIIAVFFSSAIIAQEKDCPTCPDNGAVDKTEYDVIKLKDQMYEGEFVPGEILIKLKDDINPVLGKTAGGNAVTGVASIDAIFALYKVTNVAKLFKTAKRLTQPESFTTFNGYTFERPSLHNIHKLEVEETTNIFEVIEALKNDTNIEYAEPNYIYAIVEDEPISPELTESEMIDWIKNNPEVNILNNNLMTTNDNSSKGSINKINVVTPNDPLYSEQWGIPACQIDAVWDSTTGDTTTVIAILDTGVDWMHPDLQNKIWTNPGEIPNNGVDDDGNGFVDDIRGWDYINNDNNPTDDNSHGTHVAGIVAAETDNGIGIAGVNWKAKVMPIKVFQSSGRGDAATITQGIIYASNKGAAVINMSFSSSSRSLTMEAALANAYANTILVAAAGNDRKCIGPGIFCKRYYPAAISYVLGIEATQQFPDPITGSYKAMFSNFDQDGPVFSRYEELNNYELKAPGVSIISTIPNGNYRVYNGTSMSTPLVCGAVSLYRELFTGQSQELMWGNFINTISNHIQVFDAINIQSEPALWFVSNTVVDTLDGDADGRVDAGETIELWFTVRNTWGQSDSVWCGIRFGEFEDTTTATILENQVFIGSISPYARRTNEMNPMKIRIGSNVDNDRDIVFEACLWYKETKDTTKQQIILNVENGEELSGIMDSTFTLTSDKLWLVNSSYRIGTNGILYIKPNTKIILNKNLNNNGKIFATGKKDSLIIFNGPNVIQGNGINQFDFVNFIHIEGRVFFDGTFIIDHSVFSDINLSISSPLFGGSGSQIITNSVFKNIIFGSLAMWWAQRVEIRKSNFFNIIHRWNSDGPDIFSYNNISDIVKGSNMPNGVYNPKNSISFKNNNFISNNPYLFSTNIGDYEYARDNYWGSINKNIIDKKIYEFWDSSDLAMLVYMPFLTQPSDSAHGIVWKVLVDGVDPQDEVLDPIGVGTHRFDVYFNRPMDIDYPPNLSFGVREPYNQQAVTDSSFWSADSMIWTAYKTIQLYTGDGINRIRVVDARDTEDFEIPPEDQRFEFVIDAAGLSSTDFNAIAGLGKIALDWKTPEDVTDLLGYNIYRFTNLTDTTYTDTVIISSELVTDTTYTDFDVIPNDNYYYQYTVVKTDFSESDLSGVVGSTALTASPGDANGDLSVNVLDITSIVSYLLNQNPQPFIYEAADIDTNNTINVLDIVSAVNIIMGVTAPKVITSENSSQMIVKENRIDIKSGENISAIQMKIVGKGIKDGKVRAGNLLKGMELSYRYDEDTLYVFAYSFKNKSFNQHESNLLSIDKGKIIKIDDIIAGNAFGQIIDISSDSKQVLIPKEYVLYQNYPNPFNPTTTIRYGLTKSKDVEINIFNILGQRIKTFNIAKQTAGYHEVEWNSVNNNGYKVATGVYIYQIKAGNFITQKKMLLLK